MKKLFTLTTLIICAGVSAQQTATDFTANDCAGNPHNLFSELDSGKVIVLDWVMPCSSCIGPSLTAYNIVQSYASSHPGRVRFYMADDYANTTCTSLNNWATTNNMPGTTTFSNAAIDMSDYGTAGMPKIVVLGGMWHKVYYNSNGAGNATALQDAIDSALAQTGTSEIDATKNQMSAYPVPATDLLNLNFSSEEGGNALIDIYSVDGKQVRASETQAVSAGTNTIQIGTADLTAGVYFVTVTVDDQVMRTRVVIE